MGSNSDLKELTLAELLDTSFVRCEHCNNVFTIPLLLPCLHTFCEKCILEIVTKENIDKLKNEENVQSNQRKQGDSAKVLSNSVVPSNGVPGGQNAGNIFKMCCPTCKSQITIVGKNLEAAKNENDNRDVEQKPESNQDHKEKEKMDADALDISASIYKLMKDAIRVSLTRNHFLESIARLYKYRNDVGRECAYCKTEDVIAEATSLCLQCSDDMCDGCASAHRKTRVTRDHSVVPYSAIQQGLFDHDIRTVGCIYCDDHPETTVAYFCNDCLKVICKFCRSKKHHGHGLHHLKDGNGNLAMEITQVQQGLSRRIPDLANHIKFLSKQLNSLQQSHSRTIEEIETQVELIHRMADEWKAKVISTLESETRREQKDIEDKIDDIKLSKMSMEKSASFLLHLFNLGKPDEKIALYPSIMRRYQQLLRTKPKAMTSRLGISFTPGPTTDQNIRLLIGKLGLKQEPLSNKDTPKSRLPISSLMPPILHPPVLIKSWTIATPESAAHPSVTTENDNSTSFESHYISGIDIKGNMLAAVDREKAKVIIVDMANQNVLKEFTGSGDNKLRKPFDVVFLPSGALAVTDPEACAVRVFDWTGKFILTFERWSGENRRLNHKKGRNQEEKGGDSKEKKASMSHPRGITLNRKGEVVVVDSHQQHCTVHDSNTGKLLNTIYPYREEVKNEKAQEEHFDSIKDITNVTNGTDSTHETCPTKSDAATVNLTAISKTSNPILVDPSYLCFTQENNLVITDAASPNMKILSPDGMVLQECMDYGTRAEESLHPAGVCVDKSGYILLADTINSRIHLGLPDGQFSDILVSSKSATDLSHPISVCLNQEGHIVVAQVGGTISIYKYL